MTLHTKTPAPVDVGLHLDSKD